VKRSGGDSGLVKEARKQEPQQAGGYAPDGLPGRQVLAVQVVDPPN
jgi:hypothetical protein